MAKRAFVTTWGITNLMTWKTYPLQVIRVEFLLKLHANFSNQKQSRVIIVLSFNGEHQLQVISVDDTKNKYIYTHDICQKFAVMDVSLRSYSLCFEKNVCPHLPSIESRCREELSHNYSPILAAEMHISSEMLSANEDPIDGSSIASWRFSSLHHFSILRLTLLKTVNAFSGY